MITDMKKLVILALLAVIIAGCDSDVTYTKHQTTTQDIGIFEYDSCEYITIYGGISHKGNCKYCTTRRKAELKKLVEQLKKK